MKLPEQSGLNWIKASKSMSNGACVELAPYGGFVLIRDSKNPGVVQRYSLAEIDAFIDGAKQGEFDHLISGI
jgi:hypothetical protein